MSKQILPGDGDPRHGTANGYSNLKCRCASCREAWRIAYAERRAAYRARPWPESAKHGTVSAYTNYACRCGECRAAHAELARTRAARQHLGEVS